MTDLEYTENRYAAMVGAIRRYAPHVDMAKVDAAFAYADEKHNQQKRKDGSPYIIHPLAVAEIVAEIGLDTDAILAAILHDCIEDTDCSFDDIKDRFGLTVAQLVEGVTKLTRVQYSTTEQQQMENLRKMFMAMSQDIRVILIKIADRLHNTRTMQFQTPAKQISKSTETMEIYAPLAHRLGMQKIKWELEDISLKYLEKESYDSIMEYLDKNQERSDQFMRNVQSTITTRLSSVGIHGHMYGRVKHVYSIWRKMVADNKQIDELYDLYAFRVIVDSIPDCYNVLGHVHDLFHLVPGRFKDYISTPKPNLYQSLHTTVIGKDGIPFEVQIRTHEMHRTAEYGVAAHWKYKQGGAGAGEEKDFEWVRRLLENQQDTDAEEFVHSLKVDMFDDEVFVFTPNGKVINLPAGSTPIDFAYAIHSAVGNSMTGAKIMGRIAKFDEVLKNGDVVEVLTTKNGKGPSRDWLKICKSNQARNKIKQWFKRECREDNIVHGKASFESELRRMGVSLSVLNDDDLDVAILKKLAFETLDDLYAAIGYGGLTALKAVGRIKSELVAANKIAQKEAKNNPLLDLSKQTKKNDSGVVVAGIDSCMVKFARCCTPVPGDDIVGFITRGFGVSIHRTDCPNAKAALDPAQQDRWVSAAWQSQAQEPFSTSLEIYSAERQGVVVDIATLLATMKLRVTEISGRDLADGKCFCHVTFEVKNIQELQTATQKIRNLPGVTDVNRGKS